MKHVLAHRILRVAILAVLLALGFALLVGQLSQSRALNVTACCSNDFTQYYSAARLLLHGANPYDPVALLAQERAVGWLETGPIMMWNPPWTLALALPLLVLPFGLAALAWLMVNIAIVITCGAALWHVMAPGDRRYWIGMCAAILFMPTLQALRLGQISPWLLAGITGFLVAIRARRDGLAGASLALLTIKPHITLIFLLAIAWWVVRERRWRVLAGSALTLGVACAVVGVISPAIFGQYLRAAISPPLHFDSATLGTWLSSVSGSGQGWIKWLPAFVGIILLVAWLIHYQGSWDWPRLAPGLLLAATISAVYGWPFDQVTLLPVAIAILGHSRTLPAGKRYVLIGLYAFTQIIFLILYFINVAFAYFYFNPLILAAIYAWQRMMTQATPPFGANQAPAHD